MSNFTGEEITALADTIETALTDERDYILGAYGFRDYDDEWPEVAEIKATRWTLVANALNKLGQTFTADQCEELAVDIRATIAQIEPKPTKAQLDKAAADTGMYDQAN